MPVVRKSRKGLKWAILGLGVGLVLATGVPICRNEICTEEDLQRLLRDYEPEALHEEIVRLGGRTLRMTRVEVEPAFGWEPAAPGMTVRHLFRLQNVRGALFDPACSPISLQGLVDTSSTGMVLKRVTEEESQCL